MCGWVDSAGISYPHTFDGYSGYLSDYCTILRRDSADTLLGHTYVHVDTEYAEAFIVSGIRAQQLAFVIYTVVSVMIA
jgi:hypothetical protein